MRTALVRSFLFGMTAAAAIAILPAAPAADDDKDFKPLFNGKDFEGWKFYMDKDADPKQTWSARDNTIVCTGHPNGYIYTDKSFKNYVIRYDWKYPRPADLDDDAKFLGNSGLLFHIQNPGTPAVGGIWPQCVEAQGMNRDHGMLYMLKTKGKQNFNRQAKNQATRPVGEWNTTEVTCNADGSLVVKINGTEVNQGKSDLTEGTIGFQSEGAEIHFRNIKIKDL